MSRKRDEAINNYLTMGMNFIAHMGHRICMPFKIKFSAGYATTYQILKYIIHFEKENKNDEVFT
jgi:hypothetical protein